MWIEMTAGFAGLAAYSFLVEPRVIRQRKKMVTLSNYEQETLTILHLSDFHFFEGQHFRRRYIQKLGTQVEPDFIFITGDLIDDDSGIDLCLDALAHLRARHGIFAVLGNHDYSFVRFRDIFHKAGSIIKRKRKSNDTARLLQGLQDIGIVVLQNERKQIQLPRGGITIAGLDDPYLRRDDISKTFDGYQKNGPCFVLSHTPDPYLDLIEQGADMIFSGHTHGGQIRIPLLGPLVTRTTAPRHFVSGLSRVNGSLVYNTTGLGSSRMSYLRLFCLPEITMFTVRFSS
jgi:uncharacterized protein